MSGAGGPQGRAWGWVRHLTEGGTVPWAQWHAEAVPAGRVVPGAQQLELLRRLNAAGPVPAGLATRVLEASAPGRGRPDLELVGAAHDSRFGARPVDPGELPDEELLRVAAYLLAEDLVALGPVPRRPDALPRPWRKRYRLVGDPLLSDPVRRALTARGRGPRPGGDVVVVGADLQRMLADTWTARCFTQGAGSWPEWLEGWRQRGRVPARVDLPRIARTWGERRGTAHVHVLLEGSPDWARLPALVGVRRLPAAPRPGLEAAELARRLAAALSLMVTGPRRAELLTDGLLPRLPAPASSKASPVLLPVLPPEHRGWVARRATRMERRLAKAGYAAAPGALQPPGPDLEAPDESGRGGSPGDVLGLATTLLLGGWRTSGSKEAGVGR